MGNEKRKEMHNKSAPYWAFLLVILGLISLSTSWIDLGTFWKGYVLDMAGPAWNYILIRGLFTSYKENSWTRIFTPIRTFILFVLICYGIELMQYFELYESTFDPYDLLAYISLLTPVFIRDLTLIKRNK